jgi:hypothetical protein
MTETANQSRRVQPTFSIGDRVYVNLKNFATARPSKKLDRRHAGPYPISQVISDTTYRVQLPPTFKHDDAFHVSLLQRAEDANRPPFPGQLEEEPLPVEVDRGHGKYDEWEVEKIVDTRIQQARGRVKKGHTRASWIEYRVKWKGFNDLTWENEDGVQGCAELVAEYHNTPSPVAKSIHATPLRVSPITSTTTDTHTTLAAAKLTRYEDTYALPSAEVQWCQCLVTPTSAALGYVVDLEDDAAFAVAMTAAMKG